MWLSFNKLVILKDSSDLVFSIDPFCLTFNQKQHRWAWGICLKPWKKGQVLLPDLTALSLLVGPGIQQHMSILLVCHSSHWRLGSGGRNEKDCFAVVSLVTTAAAAPCASCPSSILFHAPQLPFPTVCQNSISNALQPETVAGPEGKWWLYAQDMEQLPESSHGGIPAIMLKYEVISVRGITRISSQKVSNNQNLQPELEVYPA